jgi:beta-lactamase superfamily II metal-dependent hydrolase
MFKFHVVQAEEGDSLVLEYGKASQPRFILIDGGPRGVYQAHLREVLGGLPQPELELVILSHVDDDHIIGLVELFAELYKQQVNETKPLVTPKALWHNAFSQTLTHTVQQRLANAVASAPNKAALQSAPGALTSISNGSKLRGLATDLNLPVNPGFGENPISVDTQGAPFQSENLTLTVVGPTQANLVALRDEWQKWLDKNEKKIAKGEIEPTAMSDKSVPNLSSIILVAKADDRTLLLTGDGRGDFILEGLVATGYLPSPEGRAHFDYFKVPHHGSDRNVDAKFFQKVTADHYVISANGKHDNPDLVTLKWILEAAQQQQRRFTLHVTNNAPGVQEFVKAHPPASSGYTLNLLEKGKHALTLSLA